MQKELQNMSPEEKKKMKEKLENMSEEELREFQKKQCIFCRIIDGEVESKKVYEDSTCIAILDINPAKTGHMIILPKEHYSIMPQVPEEQINHMGIVAKKLSKALLKTLEIEGTNTFIANGPAAGQNSQHFMIHIIPREENDNVGMELPMGEIEEDKLKEIQEAMLPAVEKIFDIEIKKTEKTKKDTSSSKKKETKSGKSSDKSNKNDLDKVTEMFK